VPISDRDGRTQVNGFFARPGTVPFALIRR